MKVKAMKYLQIATVFVFVCAGILAQASDAMSAEESSTEVVSVPDTIVADLSKDVTAELNTWLAAVPNGSTIQFPAGAKYRIDETVLIENKENLTIDGNGVLFRAFDPGEDHDKKTSYTGWKHTRSRAHIRVTNSKGIRVRDIEVHGAHPDAGRGGKYDYNREAQHGFDLVQIENCHVEKVNVHDVYGDCVYISKAKSVVLSDSTLVRCGRQGVAVGAGEDVLIENNLIADSRRGIIDVEPYGEEWNVTNVRIIGNRLGGSRLLLLPMGGSGVLGSMFIADNTNTEQNGTPAVNNRGKAGQGRGPLMMVNNQFTIGGSPAPGLRIEHNEGVFIAGNTLKYPEHRQMTAVKLEGCEGAVVGNHFAGAATVIEDEPNNEATSITSLSNTLKQDGQARPTEWKRIPGGFAVRVKLGDSEVISLMRGGPARETRLEKIEGYGQSTSAEFAWYQVKGGAIVASGVRKP